MALFLTRWLQNSPYLRLEENFKSKLNIARGAGRGKAPEIWISDASVQTVELSMIPRVEKLSPKLNSHSLCELSVLDEAQVPIINTGTDDPIAAATAHRSRRRRENVLYIEIGKQRRMISNFALEAGTIQWARAVSGLVPASAYLSIVERHRWSQRMPAGEC